ncbi:MULTISPECIES: ABC transporter ATP-binding protein [unclassified Nocardioides]|uniref:ABC transporter ATP-binding protein n=1 Tax=unclassified Nocardioides TaxID=2615069 RepID=UPI0006F2DEA5|nr:MULTISPECIES: ATP-binding cassette domain-containing protein [unclassified Nocardioides]KRA31345.1 ABC transporter [Nocardioides sp. Root614]KRA87966.1 ABC transporter [Nocardioides sp. Root682]
MEINQNTKSSGPVIRTVGLTRHFTRGKETIEAVRGLDLEVAAGELVAFLGPNGAGKSTTLRMLTTLIAPTEGTAEVAGFDVVRDRAAVRRSIGYVGQGNAAGHQFRGRDEVMCQARAHGLSRRDARVRTEELLEAFDLTEHADRPVAQLSGGQRRRLDVAIGLVQEPPILFLDEPSTGLDPQNRANLQEQVRRLNADLGTTIVLTTHYLEEADALAGRVVVIDHGEVIADDTAARLKSALGDLVSMEFADAHAARAAAERADRIAGAQITVNGTHVAVRAAYGRDAAPGLVADLAAAGTPVSRLEVAGPTLDDVFLNLTGRSLRESQNETATTEGAAA